MAQAPALLGMTPVLFANPKSGDGKAGRVGLADRARERGIETVVLTANDDLAELVGDAVQRGAEALGVAGGDGSLAVVATAALAHDLPFVCIPAGTRNHFARDLGLDPEDMLGALDAFTDGVERRIDVGEVNGRPFLNNVSLGIYGDAVRRPRYRDAKARTLLETAAEVLGPSGSAAGLELVDDRGGVHRDPAVVLVSNNPYALEPPRGRPRLDGGELGVISLDALRPGEAPPRAWTTTQIEVAAPEVLHAGVDGEAVDLTPPLDFRTLPAALRVRVPSHGGAG